MAGNQKNIKAIISDMDGVIWKGNQAIVDLQKVLSIIRERDYRLVFVTNNATLSIEQNLEKLRGFGIYLEHWQVINSGVAVAHLLLQRFPNGGPVYTIGENGLKSILAENGFTQSEEGVIAVVVGLDRQLTYEKLKIATLLIRSGIPFYGTNPDKTYPTPQGLIPGAGTVITAVEVATDVKPILAGKPGTFMYELALQRLRVLPEEAIVIGDRLDTDIAGGQILGCVTGLVLSGVATENEARQWQPQPDYVAQDFEELIEML